VSYFCNYASIKVITPVKFLQNTGLMFVAKLKFRRPSNSFAVPDKSFKESGSHSNKLE
jgi:hypothetical protein